MKYLYHHRTQGLNVEGVHIRSICVALESLGNQVQLVSVSSTDDDFHSGSRPVEPSEEAPRPSSGFKKLLSSLAAKLPEPLFELLEIGYNFYAFLRLLNVVRKNKPDRIYERYSMFLFSTLLLSKIYKIPIVYEINDSAVLERVRPLFFKKIAMYIEKKVFNGASGLVYVSHRLRERIETAHGISTENVITPNAADKSIFYSNPEIKESAKEKLSLQGKTVCGFIGSFAPWHGVHTFVEQMIPTLKSNPSLALLLVGDGHTRESVRSTAAANQLEGQVILPGNVQHHEIINYIRAMDIAVLPSTNDYGSPMKLFELMGTGVPLVAADYPPVVEIIEDQIDGWLFPKGELQDCIDTLLAIFKDQEKLADAAKNAQDKVHSKHQWENNAIQLEEMYALFN